MTPVPSTSQRRLLWTAVTALSIAIIGSLFVGLVYLIARVLSFLQPILVPFAVAGVLAYLLEPAVALLVRWKLSRPKAVWVVFSAAMAGFVGVMLIIVPAFVKQGADFAREAPRYVESARSELLGWASQLDEKLRQEYNLDIFHLKDAKTPATPVVETPAPPNSAPAVNSSEAAQKENSDLIDLQNMFSGEWLKNELPSLFLNVWNFIKSSLGGFLGAFGFLVSLITVPLYLYYFLTEGPRIAQGWMNYLPLRASHFKDEVVDTLTEINGYLIAFFRGQLVVSIINGVATAVGLTFVGLNFGWLIGLSLCFLGIMPYIGITLCWVSAVLIASVQGGSWLVSAQASWWVFPLVVTCIIALVQQVDSFFITPRVVGNRVGLHPMTVIASVFAWPIILGGLLGAILAVPMTASVKVLFQRYVWERGRPRKPVE